MTHDEMIAVLQAHRDGKQIEVKTKDSLSWSITNKPVWNFADFDYRIAAPRWRDATIDDLKRAPKCRVRGCITEDWRESTLAGYSRHNVVKWQTSDFFWHRQCQVLEDE